MFRLLLIASLCSLAALQPVGEASLGSNANKFIDGLLKTANAMLPAHEPLPDIGTKLNLKDCFLSGLDEGIYRYGNATMNFVNGTMHIKAGLYLKTIGAQCSWKFGILNGTMEASTSLPAMHMELETGLSKTAHPKLDDFQVLNLGKFDINVTGVSFMDKVIDDLAKAVVNGPFHGLLIKVLETKLPAVIQEQLDNIHI